MHLSISVYFAGFPKAEVVDSLYSTPSTGVLQAGGEYGGYDYCSMPHPKAELYEPLDGNLLRVEYVQRHQRRTPYNLLPEDQFYCGSPNRDTLLKIVTENSTVGTCQYPQLTDQGVLDAWKHGKDLWDVYGTLGLLPNRPDASVGFRTSNSPLTEATAYGVLNGIWPSFDGSVHQMPASEDTVNAGFDCAARDDALKEQTSSPAWTQHLAEYNTTFEQYNLTGSWITSLDHLCDNFQAKVCNGYPSAPQTTLDSVFAGGDWEWDYAWRRASTAEKRIKSTEGLFINEIVARLQGDGKYHHTFAHDGDIGPLAAALGISYLRWPGMASNIAIEIWQKHNQQKIVRVLYCGSPIRSTWVQAEHDYDDFLHQLGKFGFDGC